MMDMARLTSCLSRPHLNLPTSSSTSLISLTSKQGKSTQSYLGLLAAISPLVRSVLPPCSCHHPHDHDLLLLQIDETVVSLLLQFVAEGLVTATLRNCTQVLETLQVLGAETGSVMLEKKKQEIIKEETCVEDNDSNFDTGEGDEEDEIGIVYEGQSSNVTRLERVSFVTMKTEAEDACSRTSRQQQRKINDVFIPKDRYTRKSRGYAFVRFVHKEDARNAYDGLDRRMFDGKELRIDWNGRRVARSRDKSMSPRKSGISSDRRRKGSRSRSPPPPRISRSRGEDRGGGRHIEKDRSRRRTLDRSVSREGFKDESESNEAREDGSKKYD